MTKLLAILNAAAPNVLGLAGVVLLVIAVAGLAGGLWAVLLLGVILLAMSYAAQRQAGAAETVAAGAIRTLERVGDLRRAA